MHPINHIENGTPIPEGFYVLGTPAFNNTCADARNKYDWRKRKSWDRGTRFEVVHKHFTPKVGDVQLDYTEVWLRLAGSSTETLAQSIDNTGTVKPTPDDETKLALDIVPHLKPDVPEQG